MQACGQASLDDAARSLHGVPGKADPPGLGCPGFADTTGVLPVMRLTALVSVALLSLIARGEAHDLWLTPGTGESLHVHYGHPDEPSLPSAAKLVSLTAIGRDGSRALTATPAADGSPVLSAPLRQPEAQLVAASYDNGYWVRLGDGSYRNASRRLVPEGAKSQWSMKFAKAVLGAEAPYDRVVGHALEIVPLENPGAAKGAIRVRVLFEGRPVVGGLVTVADGAKVEREADLARARTDTEGVATVPLKQAGPQILSVGRKVTPSATPDLAETDAYAATLSFTVLDPKTN